MTKVERLNIEAAAQYLRTSYPEETRNITFLDLSAPEAEEKIAAWLGILPIEAQEHLQQKNKMTNEELGRLYASTGGFALTPPGIDSQMLAVPSNAYDYHPNAPNPVLAAALIFLHEAGHIIVGNGKDEGKDLPSPERKHNRECVADAFMLLHALQMGLMDKNSALDFAERRAAHGGAEDPVHDTSEVLYKLVEKYGDNPPGTIPPEKIKEIAADYRSWSAPEKNIVIHINPNAKTLHRKPS